MVYLLEDAAIDLLDDEIETKIEEGVAGGDHRRARGVSSGWILTTTSWTRYYDVLSSELQRQAYRNYYSCWTT